MHGAADALGDPVRVLITPGQRNDVTQAAALLLGLRAAVVVADRGYDADWLRAHIAGLGARAVIPPTAARAIKPAYDRALYGERNAVERLVSRLKQCRRVATRDEKTARNYAGFVYLAALLVLLR